MDPIDELNAELTFVEAQYKHAQMLGKSPDPLMRIVAARGELKLGYELTKLQRRKQRLKKEPTLQPA